jgi:peptide/nickel transport system substrate-binding protein
MTIRGNPRRWAHPSRPPAGVTVGIALVAMLFTACNGDRQASRGGQVVVGHGSDIEYPNLLVSQGDMDNTVNAIVFRPLLEPEWADGWLAFRTAEENPMALARSYEFFGPDSASLRYHLRTDAFWSDGRPITAHDAAWTLEARGNPAVASPRMDYNREFREIVVEDDSTLVIHFNRRYPEMIFQTAGGVLPRHVYEGVDLSQIRAHPSVTNPAEHQVSSGAFRIAQWLRGQRIVLERNPDIDPQPHLDRIIIRVIPDETVRVIELQTGNVDMVLVPYHFIQEVRRAGNVRIEAQENRSYEYILFNPLGNEFFADPDVRRALGLAIDVDALISGLEMGEFARPAGGPYPSIFRNLYDAEAQAPLPHDIEEARRILAGKGFVPGTGGILARDGVPFRFTVLTNVENQRRVDVAQIIEQQLRRVGVDMRIQALEFNTVLERTTSRQFEASIGGWGVGLSQDYLYQLFGDPDLPFNLVGYDNPEVQRLMSEALDQPTEEAAAPYWREIASLIVEDQPYTWLYYYDRPWGINNRLRGTIVDPLGEVQHVWKWYLEE